MSIVENIKRIGIFMIAAQTVMHLAAGRQYEKYMKIIASVIILLMFIDPFVLFSEDAVADWKTQVERLEQQLQGSMQQEMPYVVNPVGTVALQQIEEEIRKRLNDQISDPNCSVLDVEIDLEETDIRANAGRSDGERSWVFKHVKVILQDMTAEGDDDGNEDRIIKIEEITVGLGAETETQTKEMQDSVQDAEIREYQQLFAQILGITDDRVEVIYHGGW